MRIIIFYDLPMDEKPKQKEYTKFHKWIVSRGYIMMQYSVYIKLVNVPTKLNYELTALKKNLPGEGNIRVLTITEGQYTNMKVLRGSKNNMEIIGSTERFLKL